MPSRPPMPEPQQRTLGLADTQARDRAADLRPTRPLDGAVLLAASMLAVGLWWVEPVLGFLPLVGVLLLGAMRWLGVGACLPRTPTGWLVAVIIVVTCAAPAMGPAGTLARTALAGLALLATCAQLTRARRRLPRAVSTALTVLLLALLASALAAPSLLFGASRLMNWVMFVPLLLLTYVRPDVRAAVSGVVGAAVLQMVGVGLQAAGMLGGTWGGLVVSGTAEDGSRLTRYTGFVMNPNNLSLILALGIIVLTTCLFAGTTVRLRLLCLGLIPLLSVGVVLTGSRGGIVAVALGVLVVIVRQGARGWLLGLLVAGVTVGGATLTSSAGIDRVLTSLVDIVAGTDTSGRQRAAVWADRLASVDTWELVRGAGFGGYAPELFAGQRGLGVDVDLARQATVDNGWLKLVLESGFVGALSLAVLLLGALATALSRRRGGRSLLGIGAGAALVAIVWRSLSVDILDQNPWNAVLFVVVGLALASGRLAREAAESATPAAGPRSGRRRPT